MSCSRAFCCKRSVCSFGISMASLLRSSSAVSKTGAECANSGNIMSRTGRNGAAPATAESIIESMRSVLARIALRSIGFGISVWQHATEYLICSIFTFGFIHRLRRFSQIGKWNARINDKLISLLLHNLSSLRINHWRKLVRTGGIDVHLFAETVSIEQERARPAGAQRRQRVRIERKTNLITGP